MGAETVIKLGNVHLTYSAFEWPKYRGTVARAVEIDVPGEYFDRLKALASSLGGQATFLEISGPGSAGATPSKATVKIEGVYIDRVIRMSDALTRVILYDRRFVLSRYIASKDFNIQFGDDYLEDTRFEKYQAAIQEFIDSRPGTESNFAEFVNPESRNAPDGLHVSGLTFAAGLGDVLERYGMSLTVWNDGKLRIVEMGDANDKGNLPKKTDYSWNVEPGWTFTDSYICGKPAFVYVYYPERHCLRLRGSDPNASIAYSGPPELRLELEQVYKTRDGDGKPAYLTLEELLEAHNFSSTLITDADICNAYMTENFDGTALYSEIATLDGQAVIDSISECWRTLWRVKPVGDKAKVGGWKDWVFGKINPDGSVQPVVVECQWVEFLQSPHLPETAAGQPLPDTLIGAAMTLNHESPAPFTAAWEGGDPSLGIIRLDRKKLPDGAIAVPGKLRDPLTIKQVQKIESGDGKKYDPNTEGGNDALWEYVASEPRSKARFVQSFDIAVYVCATRMMPNNETRWHQESVEGFPDADIGYVELPVSGDVYCIRDYVNTEEVTHNVDADQVGQPPATIDPDHQPLSDGLGQILNLAEVENDAETRADVWKSTHMSGIDGFGVAESIPAFLDVEVRGCISEVVLMVDNEEVKTRISAGNLSDNDARNRKAQKRIVERRFKTRGAV